MIKIFDEFEIPGLDEHLDEHNNNSDVNPIWITVEDSDEEHIDQEDCFCEECPSFDELNTCCWAVKGRFGENISPDDIVCDYGFARYFDPKTKVVC